MGLIIRCAWPNEGPAFGDGLKLSRPYTTMERLIIWRLIMARGSIGLAVMLMAGLFALSATAQNSQAKGESGAIPTGSVSIDVTNSGKDIEIFVAKLLKDTLKLESSLQLVNDNPENLRLHIPLGANEEQGVPRLLSVIDTTVVARDKAGNALSQIITIAATADLSFTKKQMPKLLQWANAWNARMIPIRVFIADKRVYTGMSVLGTKTEPTSSDRVVGSFLGVARAWPAVMRDLKVNKFLSEKKEKSKKK